MIGSCRVIAEGLGGPVAEKDRACIFNKWQQFFRRFGHDFEVLGRDLIRHRNCMAEVLCFHYRTKATDRRTRDLLSLEKGKLPPHLFRDSRGESLRNRHKYRRCEFVVFCLAQKVGCNDRGLSGIICYDEYFTGPRNHIYIDKPEDHPFCRSYKYIARAHYLVNLPYALRPICHGSYGLRAS